MRLAAVAIFAVMVVFNAVSLKAEEPAKKDEGWVSLFDGKTLDGWKVTDFAGHGEPKVEDGAIVLPFGSDMTGVTYTGKGLLRDNYEIELEARRVDGNDFFCALTFPVKNDPCTLVCGGWGGGVVGLSSINGMDASENSTSSYRSFKKGQWYRIRVRVAAGQIQAWIDKDRVVDFPILDNQISIRFECEPSKPLGISTWCTTGAAKNIRIRKVDGKEADES
jgi:hypothetical protein